MKKSGYRLDIQGLRAVAVFFVLFNHAGIKLFSGGYIGVDIFFVISGYVITGLILREYKGSNSFNFKSFYIKRLQRLAPALLVMVTVVVWFVINNFQWTFEQINDTVKTAYYAIFWVSNFYYGFRNIDYFETSIGNELFLHTWSLGVEEQFYLLWPAFLYLILRFSGSIKNKVRFFVLFNLSSLLLHFLLSKHGDMLSFYMMPTRIWQFGVGGLVAFLHFHQLVQKDKTIYKWLAVLGLILVIFSAIILNEHNRYPYWQVLVPTIGTVFILLSYQVSTPSLLNRALSFRPMVWLGDLSYSIYLWHWPVIYLVYDFYAINSPVYGLFVVLFITLAISALSYYFIENPFRKYKFSDSVGYLKQSLFIVSMFSIFVSIINISQFKFNNSFVRSKQQNYRAEIDKPFLYSMACDSFYHDDLLKPCIFGNKKGNKKIILLGDSVLAQWFSVVEKKYKELGWQLVVLTKSSCPVIQIPYYYPVVKSNYDVCDSWKEKAYDYILKSKPDLIIMGNASSYPYNETQWKSGLSQLFRKFEHTDIKIKFVLSSPVNTGCYGAANIQTACQFEPEKLAQFQWQEEVINQFDNVELVDLIPIICPDGVCANYLDGMAVYRDAVHLTNTFIESLYDKVSSYF